MTEKGVCVCGERERERELSFGIWIHGKKRRKSLVAKKKFGCKGSAVQKTLSGKAKTETGKDSLFL